MKSSGGQKSKVFFLLSIALTFFAFKTLLRPGYFPMHDDMQAMRLLQMDKCVKDGQVPCRWVPDMGYGYGYPQFNFYAPFPYYVMEAVHLAGFGYLDSVKAGFVLSVLVAAAGMYLLGSSLWGSVGGFISSVLFVYAPYRAVDMYVRGAVGEFWAMSLLPFVFWSIYKLVGGRKKAVFWLALSSSTLFASHNLTTLMLMPVMVAWAAFLVVTRFGTNFVKMKKTLARLSIGAFWGVGLASFFLLPAWFEVKYVHIETLLQGYFNYLAHFTSVGQLLFRNYWGYGSSEIGSYDDMSFSVGFLQWVLPLITLFVLVILKRKKASKAVGFFVFFGWLGLFITHPKSSFIWNNLGTMSFFQFPWRFLVLSTFAFSVAAGALATLVKKGSKGSIMILTIVFLTLLLNVSYFQPRSWLNITDDAKFSGELWDKQQTISIFDYLPIYAKLPPAERAPTGPRAIEGDAVVVSGEQGTNWQKWEIETKGTRATLELPQFYFPGWKAWVDGDEKSVDYSTELGLIIVSTPPGRSTVLIKLVDTPIRKMANMLSFASFLAIPVFFKKGEANEKK